jgi:DNA topoisomerase-1
MITREFTNVSGKQTFVYYINGKKITENKIIDRIAKLRIPPNWIKVQISISDTEYLQATGVDSKGRTQYIYHPMWITLSKTEKYARLSLFIKKLSILLSWVNKILSGPIDLSKKEYIIAILFRILLKTHSRIGNDFYAEEYKTYGLTTLLKKHVSEKLVDSMVPKGLCEYNICFNFIGKKGIKQNLLFNDILCLKVIRLLKKIPGDRLFKTIDLVPIKSNDMNEYLKNIMGEDFTVKDFRTYASNYLFLKILCKKEAPASLTATKKILNEVYDETAKELGHTRAISKTSYVIPIIAENYLRDPLKFVNGNPDIILKNILKNY